LRFRWVFSVLAVLTILFTVNAGAQGTFAPPQPPPAGASAAPLFTPEQIAKMPVVALPVRDFKLLTSGTGWVSTGNRLLLTTDNGAHWKDISPPNPNHDHYASVFFHDSDSGWVLFSHLVQDGEPAASDASFSDWKLNLSFTLDGGATWATGNLPEWHGDRGLSDQGVVAFADKLHGWMSLGVDGNTMTAGSALLLTSDGGRTWEWAKAGSDGRIEEILALTEKEVWVVSTPEGGSELTVSHDGANSFQEITLPAPKEIAPAEHPTYDRPVFTDGLNGYDAVSYSGGYGSRSAAVLFRTTDGGRTWKPDRILSNLVEQETVNSTVVGSTWILPFAPQGVQPALVKLRPNDRIAAATHKSSGDFSNCELSFVTLDVGWMNCSGNLSSIIDGGATATSITPRARNGVLTTDPVTPNQSIPIQMNIKHSSVVPAVAPPNHIPYVSGIDRHLGLNS